jgi:hypothetical protein
MRVHQAKDAARQWVRAKASDAPGFAGAFFHGSINWLPDDALLPATSDVDVMLVYAHPPALKLGKILYRDVLLEISHLPSDQLQSPEQILGISHLAGSFQKPSVIADPAGRLTRLNAAVAREYARRRWVRQRCEHAQSKILRNLQGLDPSAPFPDQVLAWLFATGVTTHMLLAAGLRNPTVRRRYLTTRELLAEYGHLDFYEPLLSLLGCAQMSRLRVEQHLVALAEAFDAAKTVVRTPFFFASDISDLARPLAIDGSWELIERGFHREAIFWIVATYSRCQKIFHQDAPAEMRAHFTPAYRRLVGDLGITASADLPRRSAQVEAFLPRVWTVVEAILAANPAVEE